MVLLLKARWNIWGQWVIVPIQKLIKATEFISLLHTSLDYLILCIPKLTRADQAKINSQINHIICDVEEQAFLTVTTLTWNAVHRAKSSVVPWIFNFFLK